MYVAGIAYSDSTICAPIDNAARTSGLDSAAGTDCRAGPGAPLSPIRTINSAPYTSLTALSRAALALGSCSSSTRFSRRTCS